MMTDSGMYVGGEEGPPRSTAQELARVSLIDNCPDCGVVVGQAHEQGCDVALCTICGRQRLSCSHAGMYEDAEEEVPSVDGWGAVWTGQQPGDDEGRNKQDLSHSADRPASRQKWEEVIARAWEVIRGRAGRRGRRIPYTHPEVLTTGVQEGWAEAETDPARIDWAERQARALIPFAVTDDGRPVRPGLADEPLDRPLRLGRNRLGLWGENAMADAIITATHQGDRYVLLIRRRDGQGWAVPGGKVEAGESPAAAAARELQEETGLQVPGDLWQPGQPRQVPDPRGSDEAWAVTVAARADLGEVEELPVVRGTDDAEEARWVPAESYERLTAALDTHVGAPGVFAAHTDMLREALAEEPASAADPAPGQTFEDWLQANPKALAAWQSEDHLDT